MTTYKTRKAQLDYMGKMLIKALREHGLNLAAVPEGLVAESLKTAAMIGAAAERQHGLKIIRQYELAVDAGDSVRKIENKIIEQSVFAVLGYPESNEQLAAPAMRRKGE